SASRISRSRSAGRSSTPTLPRSASRKAVRISSSLIWSAVLSRSSLCSRRNTSRSVATATRKWTSWIRSGEKPSGGRKKSPTPMSARARSGAYGEVTASFARRANRPAQNGSLDCGLTPPCASTRHASEVLGLGPPNWQEHRAIGGRVVDLPPVISAIGERIGLHDVRIEDQRVHVRLRVVIGVEGALHVTGRAVGTKVIRGAEDGVVIVVDVARAVRRPGRGHELHRSLRARAREAADAAHARLNEVDGREVVPRHTELGLGLLVVAHELIDRRGLDDLPI